MTRLRIRNSVTRLAIPIVFRFIAAADSPPGRVNRHAKGTPDWSAPLGVDRLGVVDCPPLLGFRRMEAMARHRAHIAAYKGQVAEEFIVGEPLRALSQRHDISRQLIRIWVGKFEAGALDE